MEPANQPTLTEGTQAGQPVASKWSGLFRYHAAIAAVILLVAMILRPQQAGKRIGVACGVCACDR